ncbi:Terminase OS=Bifidobacterium scardovii GN=BSCA_1010 PE=4 SV=1: Terminase_4 [Gemmata massiliana]|uniref:Phage terminase small subunit P27 family n=1 Tax=Gemmata massiliana TaxID=1210884 RepID=A0A6P2CR80_9BACT|nr:phage terminase small subunit P27 family [Gemmata massiliana]VTR90826.1 Terminase OS=Bifidobacterium scardovii GN=BSCA_1010 PE=4 SV=1: Terminase_4 [Gemmata massiliana]
MGARGPKKGQYSMRPMPKGAPAPVRGGTRYKSGAPDRPKHLGKAARKVWDRTVKEMDAAGALAVADRDVLAVYCVAVADLEALSAEIERDGLMIDIPTFDRNGRPTGATNRKPHPGLKWRADLMNKVRQYAETLGLTPAARSRAGAAPEAAPTAATNKVIALRDRIAALRADD